MPPEVDGRSKACGTMLMALAVLAEEARSTAGRRTSSNWAPAARLLSTSGIEGVSTSWCRFFSSVERRLADRLSLEASEVDSGELRSMEEAMSVGRDH